MGEPCRMSVRISLGDQGGLQAFERLYEERYWFKLGVQDVLAVNR